MNSSPVLSLAAPAAPTAPVDTSRRATAIKFELRQGNGKKPLYSNTGANAGVEDRTDETLNISDGYVRVVTEDHSELAGVTLEGGHWDVPGKTCKRTGLLNVHYRASCPEGVRTEAIDGSDRCETQVVVKDAFEIVTKAFKNDDGVKETHFKLLAKFSGQGSGNERRRDKVLYTARLEFADGGTTTLMFFMRRAQFMPGQVLIRRAKRAYNDYLKGLTDEELLQLECEFRGRKRQRDSRDCE